MTTQFDHSTSWENQPPANYDNLEEKAQQVSQLFSTTITALAADVYALRHLTTWKDIIEENSENAGSSTGHSERREEFLESLCDLDDVVSAVEKKVGVLRQIVSEEQRALENLNMLHKDSIDQNEKLQHLVERCRNMVVTNKQPTQTKPKSRTNTNRTATNKSTKPLATKNHKPAREQPIPSISSSESHDQHAHIEGLSCHFDPVSVEELEQVPRTTRGRVQVCVINEALDNIGKCFHKKAVQERKRMLLLEESRHVALARYQGNPEEKVNDEELLRNLVVTEQDLRQSCAFFFAGEGTARTVLAVLKALRRIKQVPQKKKGLFMYRLCLD
jgi:Spindle and kinetochore-associated protein 1